MDTMTPSEFRKAALWKVAVGILGHLLVVGLYVTFAFAGYLPTNPFKLIPAAIPFVYICMGIIELLTGRPYQQLEDSWMSLKGWQRGVIGTLLVLVGGFLLIVVMGAAMAMFT